jgi:hypothetical protein
LALPTEIAEMLARPAATRVAVVGASRDRSKYGNIIVRDLARLGFVVIPIHPSEREVEGRTCRPTLADVGGSIDIANFVVPPDVTLEVLEALDPSTCRVVWFQPGSFDGACVRLARSRFAHVLEGDCIMVVARWYTPR